MKKNPFVVGGAVLLALVAAAIIFVFPQSGRVRAAEAELNAVEAELTGLQGELAQLRSYAQSGELDRQLVIARSQIPSTPDLEGLIADIEGAAARSGVTLATISPTNPVPNESGSLAAMSVGITASGDYFGLAEFLFHLENMDRLMRVASITMSGGDTGVTLQVSATVYSTDLNAGPGSDPAAGPEIGA